MKFLKLKTRDRGVVYINPDEIVFAAIFDGGVHVEVRTPGSDGGVSIESGPLDDPQKALDDMMSSAPPRIGQFSSMAEAAGAFASFCDSSEECVNCPYYKCETNVECAFSWALDQMKGADK